MMIDVQKLQNQDAMIFWTTQNLIAKGCLEYADLDNTLHSDFMLQMLDIKGIKRALLAPDFVFVEKSEQADWAFLSPQVMALMTDFDWSTYQCQSLPEDVEPLINILIEVVVRPYILSHHGDVSFKAYEDGILKISLHGACKGCAHASLTLKNVVEAKLKDYLSGIKSVEGDI